MFTWICPQCGREVPPAYTDCPDCAARAQTAGPAPPPSEAAPPQQYPPPPPQSAPQPQPGAQPGYPPQTGQYYAPQQYPPQQYPPGYPPPQYPPQQYPPQQYQPPQYPPPPGYPPQQYPPQGYPPPPYAPPYPPQQQSYAPPAAPRQETPPPEQPAYTPPPAPRQESVAMFASAPPETAHEPGAPRAGGTLFGSSAPPEPSRRGGMPVWLMTVLFAGGLVAVLAGVYALLGTPHAGSTPSTSVESPAAKPGGPSNAWQKFVEVSGVRFTENAKKQPAVRFVLINHSGIDIAGLAGNVTLWAGTKKSEEDAVGTFTFRTDVAANSAKDMEVPLTTKLKMYELPDWQNVSADAQITEPGGTTAK